jgi:hypothetical protein
VNDPSPKGTTNFLATVLAQSRFNRIAAAHTALAILGEAAPIAPRLKAVISDNRCDSH